MKHHTWTVAVALAAAVTFLVPPPSAAAACDGVVVIVDPGALGDPWARCAEGDPGSGADALEAVGASYEYAQRFPGLVCRIDGMPDTTATDCVDAPPTQAYWSYWHAPVEGDWTNARIGAHLRSPEPGEAEGWSFGAGDPPGLAPSTSTGSTRGADGGDAMATAGSSDDTAPPTGLIVTGGVLIGLAAVAIAARRRGAVS